MVEEHGVFRIIGQSSECLSRAGWLAKAAVGDPVSDQSPFDELIGLPPLLQWQQNLVGCSIRNAHYETRTMRSIASA